MITQVAERLMTVTEYYRMAEAGILSADDRVELIEGEIIKMSPIGSPHAGHVDLINRLFVLRLGDRAIVRVQSPVRLDEYSEPEPDITLLRPRADFYIMAHPGPEDVLLLIEVAESSLSYDKGRKAPLYARAGIIEFWVVDLLNKAIQVYRKPSQKGYLETRQVRRGGRLSPQALPGLEVSADELLR
jgi:Uma2 family endonuclease